MSPTILVERGSGSRIAKRTRGQKHGPITRLMSPSDFGRFLKPFVFLDLVDNHGTPFTGFGLHAHSGIATVTYIAEGSVRYEDTNGAILVLNDDIDPTNLQELVWAFATRCHPRTGEIHFGNEIISPLVAFLKTSEKHTGISTKVIYNCLPRMSGEITCRNAAPSPDHFPGNFRSGC